MTNQQQTVSELLPCPFCGGEASDTGRTRYSKPLTDATWDDGSPITEAFFVNCIRCGVSTGRHIAGGHRTLEQAVGKWNHRTPSPNPESIGDDVVERLRQWSRDADSFVPSECEFLGSVADRIEADTATIATLQAENKWLAVIKQRAVEDRDGYEREVATLREARELLAEADRRIAWESVGLGNGFAERVDAALANTGISNGL